MKRYRFRQAIFSCLICSLLSSCSIYKQQFDCPPPKGIPCTSVTEIESMIVETEQGADLLVVPAVKQEKGCFWCGKKDVDAPPSFQKRQIWICPQDQSSKGYYQTDGESQASKVSVNVGSLPTFFIQQKRAYELI